MATAVRVRFPPSAPARHQGLWQVAATLSFFVVSSSAASPARPLFFLPLRIWVKQVVQKVPQMPSAAASSAHPHDVSEYGKRGPRKTALPCSISQAPAMTVTNGMDAGDARGFTAPSFACDRQPAYPATGFTSSARKAVCQDTYLHPLSQQVTAKISPLSTARFSGTQVATPSPDEALPSPSVTSCSAENSIRTDHPHGMLCPDTLLLLREERFR